MVQAVLGFLQLRNFLETMSFDCCLSTEIPSPPPNTPFFLHIVQLLCQDQSARLTTPGDILLLALLAELLT